MANYKPRILIAASIYPPDPGGPAIHAKAQYEELKKRGYTVRLVALAHLRKWPFLIRHIVFLCKLFGHVRNSDVVYTHDALGAGIPAFIVSKIFSKKIIIRIGGDIPWEREAESGKTTESMKEWYARGRHKNNLLYLISKRILNRFDAVVVTTQILADIYTVYYQVSSRTVHVIVNPIPARKQTNQYGRDIIYASRLVAYKNLAFVIKVLAGILPDYPDTHFIIYGDGPERKNLEMLIQETGMTGRILVKGVVSQQEIMSATEACLLSIAPALTEFNPNYILQCISFGKPFLISRENGLPFTVPDDLLFDPRSDRELRGRILNLLDLKGYNRASEAVKNLSLGMTWEKNLEMNISLMESVV